MVELVDTAGKLVDVGADQIGSGGLQGGFHGGSEFGDGEHQVLGMGVGGHLNGQVLVCAVLCDDGLDADDGVEDIRTGVALEGGEAVHIEDIVLGGLIAQVAVLQGGQGDLGGGGVHLVVGYDLVLHHLGADKSGHVSDELLQTHDAALTGLEGLAVLAVHGAEAQMLQLSGFGDNAAFAGGPEDLLEVQGLALVGDVEDLVGGEILHTLDHGGQVRGGVDGGAVGLHQDHGRNFLLVGLLGHGNHQGAFAEDSQALGLDVLDHGRNVGVGVALAQPGLEVDVQVVIDPAHIGDGQAHDVVPNGPVAPAALLQLEGGGVGTVGEAGVFLLLGGGGRIDLFQFGNGEGSLGGIIAGEVGIEVGEVGLTLLKLGDDQTHLQAPVTQVDVADDVIAQEAVQPLQAFADDGGAQMADVQGLCHVGSAVVDDHLLAGTHLLSAEGVGGAHFFQVLCQEGARELQVDEARAYGFHQIVVAGIQLGHNSLGNLDGGALVLLGSGQRAVALVFTQVGPVGNIDPAEGCVIARSNEGGAHLFGDDV